MHGASNAFRVPGHAYCCALGRTMIATLKRSSLALSRHIGLSGLVAQSGWRRQRLLILCYHGISLSDEHRWNPGLYMSAAQFEARLALIRRNDCTVLPLGEALARLYS